MRWSSGPESRFACLEDVFVRNIGICMIRNSGQLVKAFHGLAIQSLNVFQHMAKTDGAGAHLLGSQAIKHVSIIGIGTMSANDFRYRSRGHRERGLSHYSRWAVGRWLECGERNRKEYEEHEEHDGL